jgi:spore coat protein U-like protein
VTLCISYKRWITLPRFCTPIAGKKILAALLSLALGGVAESAYGVSCSVSSSGVEFGSYDVFSSIANEVTGNIHISCSGLLLTGVNYEILINAGNSGSYTSRLLASGSHILTYNLYADAGRSVIWGDGTGETAKISAGFAEGTDTATADHPIYGRIPARQNAYVGNYRDALVITINY